VNWAALRRKSGIPAIDAGSNGSGDLAPFTPVEIRRLPAAGRPTLPTYDAHTTH
jgi:hypothetical protein